VGLIGDLKNRVSTTLSNAVDTVEKKANDAIDTVSTAASSAKKEVVEAYDKADTFVSDKATAAKKSISEQYDTASNFYNSPNKGATASTNYEVDKLRLTQPLGSRLTPEIQKSLADGVANPRSTDTDRGARGILGKDQAARAAQTITQMDGGDYETTKQLLAQAGQGADGKPAPGADAGAEKALILKAMAARSDRLKDPGQHEAAFKEVEDFAKDIRGTKRRADPHHHRDRRAGHQQRRIAQAGLREHLRADGFANHAR
jgi:vacuolar-type H+-ATPase subunit H